MTTVRVTTIVASTEPMDAYGGVRFHSDVMHKIADGLQAGTLPVRFNHDATQPVSVLNVDAGVRQRGDGEHEVWCDFDVDAEQWAAWEDYLESNNAPGGMSFTVTLPKLADFAAEPGSALPGLALHIAADAHHFADADLIEAGSRLSSLGPVEVHQMMQFSHEPPALIVLGFIIEPGQQILWGVVGNYVYDVLRRLRGNKPSAVHLEAAEGDRNVRAIIPSGVSDDVAKAAIRAWERVATSSAGIFKCDETGELQRLDDGG